jgi:hypothetical protein
VVDFTGVCAGEALDCREEAAVAEDPLLADEAILDDEVEGASGSTGSGMTGGCKMDGHRGWSEAL